MTRQYIKKILTKMAQQKLSQHEVSRKANVDVGNLNRYLHGKGGLSFERLIPVLKYLGIKIKI